MVLRPGGPARTNHQLVTGLQIENFHWLGPLGVTLCVLLASLAAGFVPGRAPRWVLAGLAALASAQAAAGFYLRAAEAARPAATAEWSRTYRDYRDEPFRLPAGSVVGGDGRYAFLAAALSEVDPLACRLVDFRRGRPTTRGTSATC